MANVVTDIVDAPRVLPLRRGVLRLGQELASARFVGDDDPRTFHVAAFDAEAVAPRVVGCASVMVEPREGIAHRLRGMAVVDPWRGRGVGGAVLCRIEAELARRGARAMWCKARLPAVGFYRRHGWCCVSGVYEIPPHGPHRDMAWHAGAQPSPEGRG